MARCYSEPMPQCHPLPTIWLLTDARNDAALEGILRRLPRGSGLVFRHYHLPAPQRRARFDALLENSGFKWPDDSIAIGAMAMQHGFTLDELNRWTAPGA